MTDRMIPRGKMLQPQPPTNVPPPPVTLPANRASNFQDQTWAEEAARAAQRHFDMAAEIVRLTAELENWRQRAQVAEADVKRAVDREQILQSQIEARGSQLTMERDIFKEVIVKISTQFATASQIILDAHRLIDEALGKKQQVPINLNAIAEAIDNNMRPPSERGLLDPEPKSR